MTPSIEAFAKNGEVLVGEVAKRQAVTNVDRIRCLEFQVAVPVVGRRIIGDHKVASLQLVAGRGAGVLGVRPPRARCKLSGGHWQTSRAGARARRAGGPGRQTLITLMHEHN